VTLRTKTLIAVAVALLALLVTEQILLRRFLLDGFTQSQDAYAAAALDSVRRHLESKIETFHERMTSWTERGDIQEHLTTTTDGRRLIDPFVMTALNLDALIMLDPAGGILVSVAKDRPDGTPRECPPPLLGRASLDDPLLDFHKSPRGVAGLLALPEGLFMVCSRPLTMSSMHGPGSLIVARQLTEDRLDRIQHLSGILFGVFGTVAAPARLAGVTSSLKSGVPRVTHARGEGEPVVYGFIPDIDGRPSLLIEAQVPATIAAHGRRTAAFTTASALAISLSIAAVMLLLMERLVLARLRRLHALVRRIGEGDSAARLDDAGQDELAELGKAMNRTLDALARARAEAESASRAKSEFLANITHEIRTPLNAIVGYAELLENDAGKPQERAEAAATIRRNAETLLLIIHDLLDLSKIEAARLTVTPVPCLLMNVVEDVVSLLSIKARDKGIALSAHAAGAPPPCVRTDPIRVRQILINLIGNAIKFTDSGSVRVDVSARHDGSACALEVRVRDTGIGIPAEHMGRLFQPFSQVDASLSRAHGGTGLGLAISRRLARLLGGDIDVESESGAGSTFTLRLRAPIVASVPDQTLRPSVGDPAPRLSGRVLVAEDSPDNRRLVLFHLQRAGASVETVSNGRDAVDLAMIHGPEQCPFDLVLMDVQMPVLDGHEAARALRAQGCTVPIVAFTAHSDEHSRRACLDSGCDDYLAKPIDAHHLIRAAAEWIERGRARRAASGAPSSMEGPDRQAA